MKNQYVADVGDFGKYSLLRAFADKGVKIGVNWYLPENDGSIVTIQKRADGQVQIKTVRSQSYRIL